MQPPSLLLLLLLLLFHLQWRMTEAAFRCNSTAGYFSMYGDYADNLKALLRDMASTTAAQGYYLSSIGTFPDEVFGAATCVQQNQRSLCQTCMDTATSEALTECPNYREAVGVYNYCLLEWSDRDLEALLSSPPPPRIIPSPPPPRGSSPPPPLPTAPPVAGNDGRGGKESVRAFAVAVPVVVVVFAVVAVVVVVIVVRRRRALTVFPPPPPPGLPMNQPMRPRELQWPQQTPVAPPKPPPPQPQDQVHFSGKFVATPYSFKVLSDATNGFARENKLGEGGFGPVYKKFHPSDGFLKSLLHPKVQKWKLEDVTSGEQYIDRLLPMSLWMVQKFHPSDGFLKSLSHPKVQKWKLEDVTSGEQYIDRLLPLSLWMVQRFHPNDGFLKSLPHPNVQKWKGKLKDGQQVAMKRLDAVSRQGERELKTEVLVVTQLQHKNLVRVLGYCIEGEEVLLVYEFMPNTSLDNFLRDPKKRKGLAWETRFKIINGIARGLLYLHVDSRQTVVHRDMKTSNILLDADMNAKISDFGLATLHDDDRTYAASKVAGTIGYIAPEFMMNGMYSSKSDIYSFGIMILEVVTGRLVESFGHGIKKFVIEHWNEGQALQVVDACLGGLYPEDEVVACLYLGLMCCHEDRNDRPTTEQVVRMLNNLPPMFQLTGIMF